MPVLPSGFHYILSFVFSFLILCFLHFNPGFLSENFSHSLEGRRRPEMKTKTEPSNNKKVKVISSMRGGVEGKENQCSDVQSIKS